MRSTLLLMLLALLLAPFASAGLTVPGGYVSTAPLVVDDHVLIRSSGTFDGLTADGSRLRRGWSGEVGHRRQATMQPDMADVVLMPAGSSACGRGPIRSSSHGRAACLKPAHPMKDLRFGRRTRRSKAGG